MPEHLRALVVILVLSFCVFTFAKSVACELGVNESDYNRRRNLWYCITLIAFLSHNFWIFITLAGLLVYFAAKREHNSIALYFFLLFAVPMITEMISVLNIFNLFAIDYARLLSLCILLPALLANRRSLPSIYGLGYHLQDKILVAYLALLFSLHLSTDTPMNVFRHYILYSFLGAFLPYYVASRTLNTLKEFRDAMMSFIMACQVLAVIAVFEIGRHWLLYSALNDALGVPSWNYGRYLGRGEFLRALATPGQAIALGFVLAIAIGCSLYFPKPHSRPMAWRLGWGSLISGLIAALSRGPWIGTGIVFIMFIITGPQKLFNLIKLSITAIVTFTTISILLGWDRMISYLPFIGNIDVENIDFRKRLLHEVTDIILKNPLFGSRDLDLEAFRTGEGIIDIVNTYLIIGLDSGLVGLGLFITFFMTICLSIAQLLPKLPEKEEEMRLLGRTLLAVLTGILVIIFTVTSITVIPYVYWSVAGVAVAYIRLATNSLNN